MCVCTHTHTHTHTHTQIINGGDSSPLPTGRLVYGYNNKTKVVQKLQSNSVGYRAELGLQLTKTLT